MGLFGTASLESISAHKHSQTYQDINNYSRPLKLQVLATILLMCNFLGISYRNLGRYVIQVINEEKTTQKK